MYGRQRFSGGGAYGLTPMVKKIMIANGVIWFLKAMTGGYESPIALYGAISVPGVFEFGFIWQPFTYMWLHADGLLHVAMNMFILWMFGGQLEQEWGPRRFLKFYLMCGVGAGLVILTWNLLWSIDVPTLGASGAVFGILTAFSLTWPDRTVMLLFPPIPMKAIWFVPILLVLELARSSGNISHAGHLGGVLVAAIIMRHELRSYLGMNSLRYRWHRYRMRNRLRAVRREEWDRKRKSQDDDDRPTYH